MPRSGERRGEWQSTCPQMNLFPKVMIKVIIMVSVGRVKIRVTT